jgi:competence protein ComEC
MQTELAVLDVGQGDCIVVMPPNGNSILVDCPSQGVDVALDYLEDNDISEIELLVLSHSDMDHMGGIIDLIVNYPGHIRNLIYNQDRPWPTEKHRKFLRELKSVCDRRGIRIWRPNRGVTREFDFAGMVLEVLGPDAAEGLDNMAGALRQNDVSIVLAVEYLGGRVILGADAERRGWEAIMRRNQGKLQAQVLKFPHHGAWHKGIPDVIDAIQPKYVIISVGSSGRFRHPRPQTLTLLRERGIQVICTEVTKRCEPLLSAKRASVINALPAIHGLGQRQSSACPCGGTISITLNGNVTVSPSGNLIDRVKTGFTTPKCLVP